MYPHTASAWHRTGEVDGVAQWEATVLQEVRTEALSAAERNLIGESAAGATRYYISGTQDISGLEVGDRIAEGFVCRVTPPAEALRVYSIEPVRPGRRVHHWEVVCT
jgi:hypothetical protein